MESPFHNLKQVATGVGLYVIKFLLNNICTVTYLPSHKPSKKGEQDMLATFGKQGRFSANYYIWIPQSLRAKNLHLSVLYGHWMPSRGIS